MSKLLRRRSVVFPPYPDLLLEPLPPEGIAIPEGAIDDAFQRLVEFYGLEVEFGYPEAKRNPFLAAALKRPEPVADKWRELAQCLIEDLIPAFKRRAKAGRRKKQVTHNAIAEVLAFGRMSDATPDQRMDDARARFVIAVREATGSGRTKSAVFRHWKTERNRPELPSIYKDLKRPRSFHDAYYSIHSEIRREPEAYLLKPASRIWELLGRPPGGKVGAGHD